MCNVDFSVNLRNSGSLKRISFMCNIDVTRSIVLAGDCDVNLEKQWLPLSNQSTFIRASESAVSAHCSNMWLNKTASAFHSGRLLQHMTWQKNE